METRQEAFKRLSYLAGYDENGCILPTAATGINREPVSWWNSDEQRQRIAPDKTPVHETSAEVHQTDKPDDR